MNRPTNIRITSKEEGMPTGQIFAVIGWTGFEQPVVQELDGTLLVLRPDDFVDAGFSGMRPGLRDARNAQAHRIKQLNEFVQFVADYSNDPAVVREAKRLGAHD